MAYTRPYSKRVNFHEEIENRAREMQHIKETAAKYGISPQLLFDSFKAELSVSVVLLDIDSPGGTVNGTPELAQAVRSLSKQKYVYAYTSGLACSAAYWVASQCDGIYAAPSARVGSIGVLMPLIDSSEALSQRGVKLDVFAAGKYKSTGTPGTALTDEQRVLLQRQVNATWEEFKAAVTHRRRTIAAEHMEGQTFTGKEARTVGLVDACANSLAAVQQKLIERHNGTSLIPA